MDPVAATPPQLPAPMTEPLALYALRPILWSDLVILALLVLALVWIIRRSRRKPVQVPGRPQMAPPVSVDQFAALVRAIEQRHLEGKTYRAGCHELDGAVRRQLEAVCRIEAESLTAAEITRVFAAADLGKLAVMLRDACFRRDHPTREHFRSLCDETRAVFRGGHRFELRAGGRR